MEKEKFVQRLVMAANDLVGFPLTSSSLRRGKPLRDVIGYSVYESVPWITFGIMFFERSPLWMRGVAVALICFLFRLVPRLDVEQPAQSGTLDEVLHGGNGREPKDV